ncbi:MAG: hypothetical protein A4S09_07880 [Proteobacteria bacterium SG_bin7]|nr:MAG: hypothetical protein A4S09_07880 [Proteobacteria bacterium SG_bin7]
MNISHLLANLQINGICYLGAIPQKEKFVQVDLGENLVGENDESFAHIASSLIENIEKNSTVLVTSPTISSGKTYSAANLALALSKKNRIGLMDLDLRLPAIKTYLSLPNSQMDFEPFSYNSNLDVFYNTKNHEDPTKFLESTQLGKFITEKKYNYDYLIMDSPPLLEVHDATLLAQKSDAVLLVLRFDEPGLKNIPQFRQRLFHSHPKPTFAVLNGVEKTRRRSA